MAGNAEPGARGLGSNPWFIIYQLCKLQQVTQLFTASVSLPVKAHNHGRPAPCGCLNAKYMSLSPLWASALTINVRHRAGKQMLPLQFEEKVTEAPAASTTFKPRWELPKPVASRSPYSLCFDVSLSLQRRAGQNFVLATRVVCAQNLHFLSLKSSLLPQQPRSSSVLWLMFTELRWGGCCKNINTWVFSEPV